MCWGSVSATRNSAMRLVIRLSDGASQNQVIESSSDSQVMFRSSSAPVMGVLGVEPEVRAEAVELHPL